MSDSPGVHVVAIKVDGEVFAVTFHGNAEGRMAARAAVFRYATDQSLPKFTGIEALSMLSKISRTRHTKGVTQ